MGNKLSNRFFLTYHSEVRVDYVKVSALTSLMIYQPCQTYIVNLHTEIVMFKITKNRDATRAFLKLFFRLSSYQACLPGKVPNRYFLGQKSGFAMKNRYKSFKA